MKKICKFLLMVGILTISVSQVSYAISHKALQRKCGISDANIKCWQNYANKDDDYAQFVLGVFYNKGIVIDKDMEKSVKWYNKSAKNGNYKAKYNLATMYYDGFEVKQDYHKSLQLYKDIAIKQHLPRAELMIARIYKNGFGVRKDVVTAYAWYMLANIQSSDVIIEESHLAKSLNNQQQKKAKILLNEIKSQLKY